MRKSKKIKPPKLQNHKIPPKALELKDSEDKAEYPVFSFIHASETHCLLSDWQSTEIDQLIKTLKTIEQVSWDDLWRHKGLDLTKTLGDGKYSWGGLINPLDSRVKLFVNVSTVTNLSAEPFTARIWLNGDLPGEGKTATKVSPSNTSIKPLPRPKVKLKYEESTTRLPTGGVNVFSREVPPFSTIVGEEDGKYIFLPGGSFVLLLEKTSSGLATAKIALGWWEDPNIHERAKKIL